MKLIYEKGNIFEKSNSFQLVVIFGHIGFNILGASWHDSKSKYPIFNDITNPFPKIGFKIYEIFPNQFQIYLAEKANHGIDDKNLFSYLDEILIFAKNNSISSLAFNGARDKVHSTNSSDNIQTTKQRVLKIINYFKECEQRLNLSLDKVNLISMNDAFIRMNEN